MAADEPRGPPGDGSDGAPPLSADRLRDEREPGLVSVIVTVKNEQRHIADLLDSLVIQEGPLEVLVVDSESTDHTRDIVRRYAERFDAVRLLEHPGTRGESRNAGVRAATGDAVAFIDGDCIANPFWLREMRRQLAKTDVAAGRTIVIGYWAFEALNRVELKHQDVDVTFPSCNLAYHRGVYEKVGGFDPRFHTAEDIDLNFRAVDGGATLGYTADAVVYARARDTMPAFVKQAFWNGYGRKQLTLKHGRLWGEYSFRQMLTSQASFWGFLRLGVASIGYAAAYVREKKVDE